MVARSPRPAGLLAVALVLPGIAREAVIAPSRSSRGNRGKP